MASERVAFYMIHPRRSKEAFAALIDDWAGILVSDGYGVYQHWVEARQTCLAHLIRTARGLAERQQADLAACGAWALAELQRLCHMATAPPTGGEWRAWYARLCKLIEQYHDRHDDAGRFARRLLREMDSLWVFLAHHGVEPTNNRAERALRFGVLWRKRSLGTASDKGNRWVERILSLKETCRLQARATYTVLVDAVTQFLPWPTTRSLLDQRGGEHLCSPPVSAHVYAGGLHHAAQRHRAHPHPRPWHPRGAARRRGAAGEESAPDRSCSRPGSPSLSPPHFEAFRQGLRDLGYVEGQNLVMEYRYAEGSEERLPDLAAELVRLQVDMIVAGGSRQRSALPSTPRARSPS